MLGLGCGSRFGFGSTSTVVDIAGALLHMIASPVELLLALLAGPDSGVYRWTFLEWREECRDDDGHGVRALCEGGRDSSASSCEEAGGETSEEAAGCSKFWTCSRFGASGEFISVCRFVFGCWAVVASEVLSSAPLGDCLMFWLNTSSLGALSGCVVTNLRLSISTTSFASGCT